MNAAVMPEVAEVESPVAYERRVLFLTGTWERPGNMFRFRATILVAKDGAADGSIYWQAFLVHEKPASYFATEWVRGAVRNRVVDLEGYECEPGLSLDTYQIALDGNGEAGPFGGITRTWLNNWSGRIGGNYTFRNRTT